MTHANTFHTHYFMARALSVRSVVIRIHIESYVCRANFVCVCEYSKIRQARSYDIRMATLRRDTQNILPKRRILT